MTPARRLRAALSALIALLMLALILKIIGGDMGELANHRWEVRPAWMVLSFTGLAGALVLVVFVWQVLLRRMGFALRFRSAFRIWHLSAVARYLPGRVWDVVGKLYLCEQAGVPKSLALASGVLTQILSLAAALVLGILYVGIAPGAVRGRFPAPHPLLLAASALILVAAACSSFPARGMNLALRAFRCPEFRGDVPLADRVALFGLFLAVWLAYGGSFSLFVLSLTDLSPTVVVSLAGVFVVSYTLGFVSLLTPGGLGVREGVMAFLLLPYLPLPVAATVSLAARVWISFAELAFFIVAWRLPSEEPGRAI